MVNGKRTIPLIKTAEILEISPKILSELIESREIPLSFNSVGRDYIFLLQEVLEYKQKIDEQPLLILQELANQAQELKLAL
jgi:uncharacterized protein YbjQ (UPF0145 family)